MHKNILYILLISYTSMLCKPLLPYVVDTVEHILLYNQHLATVHVENGEMHVHKEAVDAGADQQDDQPNTTIKKSSTSWDHLAPSFANSYTPSFIKIALNQHLPISSYYTFSFSDYPPPRLFFI